MSRERKKLKSTLNKGVKIEMVKNAADCILSFCSQNVFFEFFIMFLPPPPPSAPSTKISHGCIMPIFVLIAREDGRDGVH